MVAFKLDIRFFEEPPSFHIYAVRPIDHNFRDVMIFKERFKRSVAHDVRSDPFKQSRAIRLGVQQVFFGQNPVEQGLNNLLHLGPVGDVDLSIRLVQEFFLNAVAYVVKIFD